MRITIRLSSSEARIIQQTQKEYGFDTMSEAVRAMIVGQGNQKRILPPTQRTHIQAKILYELSRIRKQLQLKNYHEVKPEGMTRDRVRSRYLRY
jgi:hypothetical protein